MEIVIRSLDHLGIEQLFVRAHTGPFPGTTARKLQTALANLTSLAVGCSRPVPPASGRYELEIRERRGGRPLSLTVVHGDLTGPSVAVREIIRLIALGAAPNGD